jgi:hypothetical protein
MHSFHRVASFILLETALFTMPVMAAGTVRPDTTSIQTANVQSTSGRITSVEGNTFTLQRANTQQSSRSGQSGDQKTLTFTIDQDTNVDGKIAIGAEASVTYRTEDGNNIAVTVRITRQPS